jgi:DNA-directed RNA polymerase specialized sigma24 family protein
MDYASLVLNLSTLQNALEARAVMLCGGRAKAVVGCSYDDLVQDTMERILVKELWLKCPTIDDLCRYGRKVMFRLFIDRCRSNNIRLGNEGSIEETDLADLVRPAFEGFSRERDKVESPLTIAWVKSQFPGESQMHEFIDYLIDGATRKETADGMQITPREVTDLHRRFNRKMRPRWDKSML